MKLFFLLVFAAALTACQTPPPYVDVERVDGGAPPPPIGNPVRDGADAIRAMKGTPNYYGGYGPSYGGYGGYRY
jgi:hypothetical protein